VPNEYGYFDAIEAGLKERVYEGGEYFSVIQQAETAQKDPEVLTLRLKGAYDIYNEGPVDLSPAKGSPVKGAGGTFNKRTRSIDTNIQKKFQNRLTSRA